jgi:hypothetical protein
VIAVAAVVTACTVSSRPADAGEREACRAVDELGALITSVLLGDDHQPSADTLDRIAGLARAVDRAAADTANDVLRHAGRQAAEAGSDEPRALVDAWRALDDECYALGLPADEGR